jgi:hypothetical protein
MVVLDGLRELADLFASDVEVIREPVVRSDESFGAFGK